MWHELATSPPVAVGKEVLTRTVLLVSSDEGGQPRNYLVHNRFWERGWELQVTVCEESCFDDLDKASQYWAFLIAQRFLK